MPPVARLQSTTGQTYNRPSLSTEYHRIYAYTSRRNKLLSFADHPLLDATVPAEYARVDYESPTNNFPLFVYLYYARVPHESRISSISESRCARSLTRCQPMSGDGIFSERFYVTLRYVHTHQRCLGFPEFHSLRANGSRQNSYVHVYP